MVGRRWMPGFGSRCRSIASAIYSPDDVILMGISAARLLGANSARAGDGDDRRTGPTSPRYIVRPRRGRPDSSNALPATSTLSATRPSWTDAGDHTRTDDPGSCPPPRTRRCRVRCAERCRRTVRADRRGPPTELGDRTTTRRIAETGQVLGSTMNSDEKVAVAEQFGVATEQVERDHLISHLLALPRPKLRRQDSFHRWYGARTHTSPRRATQRGH